MQHVCPTELQKCLLSEYLSEAHLEGGGGGKLKGEGGEEVEICLSEFYFNVTKMDDIPFLKRQKETKCISHARLVKQHKML